MIGAIVQTPETTTETIPEITSSSSDDDEKALNHKWQQVNDTYTNNIELTPSPLTIQEMREYYLDLPLEWWEQAIKIAAANKVRKWSYIRGILDRSRELGSSPDAAGPPGKDNGHYPPTVKKKFIVTDLRTGEQTIVESNL